MTKLLDDAIAEARRLPADEQDAAAEALFAHLGHIGKHRLTPEQAQEVERIRANLRAGRTRLLSDEDMQTFWRSCGL